MKKTRMAAATAMALTVAMGMSAFAAEADLPSADVAEQGYDFYDQAVSYNDLRETLGAIPKLDEEITIGFATKTFENEFWRMEGEGAATAEKTFQDAGYKLTVDVRGAQTETDEEGQLTLLMDMVNKGYNAILVSGISEANLVPGMEAAMEAGIDLTTVMDAFTPYSSTNKSVLEKSQLLNTFI